MNALATWRPDRPALPVSPDPTKALTDDEIVASPVYALQEGVYTAMGQSVSKTVLIATVRKIVQGMYKNSKAKVVAKEVEAVFARLDALNIATPGDRIEINRDGTFRAKREPGTRWNLDKYAKLIGQGNHEVTLPVGPNGEKVEVRAFKVAKAERGERGAFEAFVVFDRHPSLADAPCRVRIFQYPAEGSAPTLVVPAVDKDSLVITEATQECTSLSSAMKDHSLFRTPEPLWRVFKLDAFLEELEKAQAQAEGSEPEQAEGSEPAPADDDADATAFLG